MRTAQLALLLPSLLALGACQLSIKSVPIEVGELVPSQALPAERFGPTPSPDDKRQYYLLNLSLPKKSISAVHREGMTLALRFNNCDGGEYFAASKIFIGSEDIYQGYPRNLDQLLNVYPDPVPLTAYIDRADYDGHDEICGRLRGGTMSLMPQTVRSGELRIKPTPG